MSDQSSDSKSKKEKYEELCETLREAHDLGSRLANRKAADEHSKSARRLDRKV